MNITMTIRVAKDADEALKEFKKRYWGFRRHVEFQQLKGILPRGEIRWVTSTKEDPQVTPPTLPGAPVWQDRPPSATKLRLVGKDYPAHPAVICGSTLMPEDLCECRYCDARRRGEDMVPEPVCRAMPISGVYAPL